MKDSMRGRLPILKWYLQSNRGFIRWIIRVMTHPSMINRNQQAIYALHDPGFITATRNSNVRKSGKKYKKPIIWEFSR